MFLLPSVGRCLEGRPVFGPQTRIYVLGLGLASLVCAVLLGMMGKKLIPVMLPD